MEKRECAHEYWICGKLSGDDYCSFILAFVHVSFGNLLWFNGSHYLFFFGYLSFVYAVCWQGVRYTRPLLAFERWGFVDRDFLGD